MPFIRSKSSLNLYLLILAFWPRPEAALRSSFLSDFTRCDQKHGECCCIPFSGKTRSLKHDTTSSATLFLDLTLCDFWLFSKTNMKDWSQLRTFRQPGCASTVMDEDLKPSSRKQQKQWTHTLKVQKYLIGVSDDVSLTLLNCL